MDSSLLLQSVQLRTTRRHLVRRQVCEIWRLRCQEHHRICGKSWHLKLSLKKGHPRPLFIIFRSFVTNITIFTTMYVKKCSSNIRCWDSKPLRHEFPPITTWPPVLPPFKVWILRLKWLMILTWSVERSGQSYKEPTIVNYDSWVFIRLATGLVVKGTDLKSRDQEYKSHWRSYGNIFPLICWKNCIVCLKIRK